MVTTVETLRLDTNLRTNLRATHSLPATTHSLPATGCNLRAVWRAAGASS